MMYLQLGQPILILIVPFAIAYIVWYLVTRDKPIQPTRYFLTLYIGMFITQAFHLGEEYFTGFYNTFPAFWSSLFYGNPAQFGGWDTGFFLFGNFIMDVFWIAAIFLFAKGNSWANYTLYLFLSGMIVNVFAHPFYCVHLANTESLQQFFTNELGLNYTWYFPGLWTSFVHAIFVVLMVREIRKQLKMNY